MTRTRDRVLGTLYGQAIGDAMGMPSELWPIETLHQVFPGGITTFLAGPSSNPVAKNYVRGEYTDDTGQALALLDALRENSWQPDQRHLVDHVLDWADAAGAWEHNILGPSSKAALAAIKAGEDPRPITARALTNGAGMRIAPIGTLFEPVQLDELVQMVTSVTRITHSSDVAFGGACLIAGAVTAAMADDDWDTVIAYALRACERGYQLGSPTWAAKLRPRVELGLRLAKQYADDPTRFSRAVYELLGTGTMLSESVPAAVAIAYYTRDVHACALMCANLGGDTDTIGAMATAICGAKTGVAAIDPAWVRVIDHQNAQHDLRDYGEQILKQHQ